MNALMPQGGGGCRGSIHERGPMGGGRLGGSCRRVRKAGQKAGAGWLVCRRRTRWQAEQRPALSQGPRTGTTRAVRAGAPSARGH